MKEFFELLKINGIKDIKNLTDFVHSFVENPSIFFQLTEIEREGMEKKLDEALAVFKNKKN
jgi:hypothetical protein